MKYVLYFHITCGGGSLILFWIPAFTRKKKGAHTRYGKIYYYLMNGVVVSALILCVHDYLIGEVNTAIFLGFLAVLSFYPMWHGKAVIHHRVRKSDSYNRIFVGLGMLLVVFGLFLIVYGFFFAGDGVNILMVFFGLIGFTALPDLLRYFKRGRHGFWYQQHFRGMIISGIAAYTAFLAFGGRQIFAGWLPGSWQMLPWIMPTVIGVIALRLLKQYYQRQGILKPEN